MKPISRRTALKIFSSAPVAAAMAWTPAEAEQAHSRMQQARTQAARTGTPFKPKFFTPHEYATVGMLANLIIPKDERSGSATDAGVPEFMDFMMTDEPRRQTAMRGGLALIDRLSEEHATVGVHGGTALEPGDRVRVLPNHSCVVSNLVNEVRLVEGERVIDTLPVAARGRIQ